MDRAPCPLSVAGGSCAKGIPNDLTVYDTEGNPHILCKNHANKRRKMEKAAEGTGDEWVRNWLDGNTADVATATAAAGVAAQHQRWKKEAAKRKTTLTTTTMNASQVPLLASGAVRHAQRVNTSVSIPAQRGGREGSSSRGGAHSRERAAHHAAPRAGDKPTPPHPTPP